MDGPGRSYWICSYLMIVGGYLVKSLSKRWKMKHLKVGIEEFGPEPFLPACPICLEVKPDKIIPDDDNRGKPVPTPDQGVV